MTSALCIVAACLVPVASFLPDHDKQKCLQTLQTNPGYSEKVQGCSSLKVTIKITSFVISRSDALIIIIKKSRVCLGKQPLVEYTACRIETERNLACASAGDKYRGT